MRPLCLDGTRKFDAGGLPLEFFFCNLGLIGVGVLTSLAPGPPV